MKPPERLRHWPDYRNLNAWLHVATAGLSEESRVRIREEIADHFHQAIAEGLRAGLTEDAAAERAVEDLGGPEAARRAFRRTYLTNWQAYLVRRFVEVPKPPPSSPFLASLTPYVPLSDPDRERRARPFIYVCATLTIAAYATLNHRESQLLIGIVALMAVATIILAAVPRIFRTGRECMAIALGALAELAVWGGLVIAPGIGQLGRATNDLEMLLWLFGVLLFVWAASHVPLLLKLSSRPEST